MASPARRARPQVTAEVQVRLPPIKSLQLAHTTTEQDTVYPTPLSAAWPPNQQFARTTPLVPTTLDPTAYPTPISARPHRTSYGSGGGQQQFQNSSFHYVPPTTAESTTSTTSSTRNFVDDKTLPFAHDRTTTYPRYQHPPRDPQQPDDRSVYTPAEARAAYHQTSPSPYTQDPRPYSQDPRYTQDHPRPPYTSTSDPRYDARATYPAQDARTYQDPRYPDPQRAYPADQRGYQTSPEIERAYQDTRYPPQDGRAAYDARYSDGRAYPQESRTYVPPPQPAPPQPQTQDTRYTPTQESRNTYPPPAPSYPPAQDTRPYAPPPPVERTYSQSHTETRGYPVERQQQQLSYDAQQGRTSSALEPQPQSQLPHSQPPREQRGSTSNDRNLGVVEPRAVEVRPTLLQRQSVGDTRPLTVETRGVGLETQVRMETQSRAVGVETQRPPAFESQRSAAFESQRPAAFESQRPAAFESQRTPAFESQRPSAFESQVRGSGVETQTQTQSRQAVFEPQQRQSNLETQGRPPVFETQTRPTTFESQARPAFEPQRQTMLEPQPRSTVIESQTRPTPFEAQPRTAVLESQARPSMMLEGPARSTGFISQLQSQSQSQSQGSQRVAGDDRLGKEDVVREIVQHCTALYKFADHYSILQSSNPHVQPSAEELAEMTARAGEVVRLLEALRNDAPIFPSSLLSASAFTSTSGSHALVSVHPHSSEAAVKGYMTSSSSLGLGIMDVDAPDRAPKRPWEDVEGMLPPGSGPGIAPSSSGAGHVHVPIVSTPGLGTAQISGTAMAAGVVQDQDRSMAEADMELIRTKRALTTMAAAAALGGNGTGGSGGKNKYRKRSVSRFFFAWMLFGV
ncbi:hypothetical protein BD769DRAFT_1498161 [Suillus cothurnatus]|nr:hypothetical protein BD769DRAFT_1498161 [Suillus cothurnatus]